MISEEGCTQEALEFIKADGSSITRMISFVFDLEGSLDKLSIYFGISASE
jgi:hypothetical protein